MKFWRCETVNSALHHYNTGNASSFTLCWDIFSVWCMIVKIRTKEQKAKVNIPHSVTSVSIFSSLRTILQSFSCFHSMFYRAILKFWYMSSLTVWVCGFSTCKRIKSYICKCSTHLLWSFLSIYFIFAIKTLFSCKASVGVFFLFLCKFLLLYSSCTTAPKPTLLVESPWDA